MDAQEPLDGLDACERQNRRQAARGRFNPGRHDPVTGGPQRRAQLPFVDRHHDTNETLMG